MASLFNADAIDDEASGNDDELEDFEDLDDEDDGQGSYLGREEDDDELFVLEHNNEFDRVRLDQSSGLHRSLERLCPKRQPAAMGPMGASQG